MPLGSTFSTIKQLSFPQTVWDFWGMMSRSCGVGQILKVGKLRGDLIAETDMRKSLLGISSCARIAAEAASWCQTRTKTLRMLFVRAAVQASTVHLAEHAVSMRKCAKKKKRLPTLTHTHTSCKCGMPPQGCTAGPQQTSGFMVETKAPSLK